ncbi:nuclear transport factor 2 family protein [Bradyrhizobium sp. Ai1a-2]|uniref:nuclear transport factor 2 family protein n=1 Tax=Bradyrhizobium sp. Ai1a-2 TaxID=196490 RepID=UPI00040343DE|nr:nuclear transport factor 2 family protein [Bradyrhizobium sp. Ai1a-2]
MLARRELVLGASAIAAAGTLAAPVALGQVPEEVQRTPGTSSDSPREEKNKRVVVAFYNAALNEKNPDRALGYVGASYRQHNPLVEEGREGFRRFIEWVRSDHPDSHSEIKRIFADGDYVIMDVHMVRFPGERGLAIGEIFRLEDGKIVEHWDRIQPIPEAGKNSNGMF